MAYVVAYISKKNRLFLIRTSQDAKRHASEMRM